jgi:hypothetical protein
MRKTVRVLSASAVLALALGAAPAAMADPAYPPTGGGGGGGVLVPPVVQPPAQPPAGGGGGGVNLPTTGSDIRGQALLGTTAGALGALLIVAAATRRRPQPAA